MTGTLASRESPRHAPDFVPPLQIPAASTPCFDAVGIFRSGTKSAVTLSLLAKPNSSDYIFQTPFPSPESPFRHSLGLTDFGRRIGATSDN